MMYASFGNLLKYLQILLLCSTEKLQLAVEDERVKGVHSDCTWQGNHHSLLAFFRSATLQITELASIDSYLGLVASI